MSRIRMHVFINNESDATLNFVRDEVTSGSYTPACDPPAVIKPGETSGFQGEGDLTIVPTTGTEGRVWYDIVAPHGRVGELYIHWNSPLIESQYGNTFHIWAPVNWEVTHSGGQGHDARLDIRLRRTALRTVPDFHPRGRGLVFKNRWDPGLPSMTVGFLWNRFFEALPGPLGDLGIDKLADENWLPLTHADAGLCGGMVFAVMDYYAAHLLPPSTAKAPDSSGDPLFQFIRDRLWDSFDVGGDGARYLGYSSPNYPNGDEGVLQSAGLTNGRSWVTYREAWPQIQSDIDAGRLAPLGLIQSDNLDIGSNHQVLAYGYQKSGQEVTLFIYDPNEGQAEVTYTFNIKDTDGEVHVTRTARDVVANDKRIFCIFRINNYAPKSPPDGRPFKSVRDALRCSTLPGTTVRGAVAGQHGSGSVMAWMRSL